MPFTIHPLKEDDLPAADRVYRLAFGALAGLRDPIKYGGDTDYIRTRFLADPNAAFVAHADGKTVGSVFLAKWGSVAIFGPLTVHPNVWDKAVGTRLLEPAMELLHRWEPTHIGLHTVVHSAKHITLFRKFGFWPGRLIEIMAKDVQRAKPDPQMRLFSGLSDEQKTEILAACLHVTESVYVGLDLGREIRAVDTQGLGDTVLLYDNEALVGFAVCHWGAGTEAGSGRCYVKFGAVGKSPHSSARFDRLLKTCEVLAGSRGASKLIAGINTSREQACRIMIAHGFHTEEVGVAMHKPYKAGYNRNDVYIMDDWR